MKPLLLGAFVVLLAACQPTELPESLTQETASPYQSIVSFASLEDYEAFLDLPQVDRETELQGRKPSAFISYREAGLVDSENGLAQKATEPLVDDAFVAEMLNPDGLVKIGPWYIRLNVPKGKVFALHADHIREGYQDLVNENEKQSHLLTFSTDTEVISELKTLNGQSQNREEWTCQGADANRDTDNRQVTGSQAYQHDTFLRYYRYGIGFAIYVQVKWRYPSGNLLFPWESIEASNVYTRYNREYEVKCGRYPGENWSTSELFSGPQRTKKNNYSHDLYRGSRKLSSYRAYARVYYNIPVAKECGSVACDIISTSTYRMDIQYYN